MQQTSFSELIEKLEISQGEAQDVRSAPDRVNQIVNSILDPGRSVILTGDPGNGKARLAEEAAYMLADRLGRDVEVFVLPPPSALPSSGTYVFTSAFSQFFDQDFEEQISADANVKPSDLFDTRLQHFIDEFSSEKEVVMVVPRADRYSGFSGQLLQKLVRSKKLRVIATAQRLSGVADRINRDPQVSVLSVGPLNVDEAQAYLIQLLRVERIDRCTLMRWHNVTGGNAYALSMLALASDRGGSLQRSRGTIWEKPGGTVVPGELQEFFLATCNETEIQTLEFVAIAEPMHEASLLQKLDAKVVTELSDRGILISHSIPSGSVALMLAHPLLAKTVLSNLSAMRRLQLNDAVYQTLLTDQLSVAYSRMPDRLMRLVAFGLESGHTMPLDWLLTAYEVLVRTGNPLSVLQLALAVASHPEANPEEICGALVRGRRSARLVGDIGNLRHITSLMRTTLKSYSHKLNAEQRVTLMINLVEAELGAGQPEAVVLNLFDELERNETANQPTLKELVRASKSLALGMMGQLNSALECAKEHLQPADYATNMMRAPALLTAAFVLQQRGEIQTSITMSESARRFALLGDLPRTDLADVQGFCALLGYWASGNTVAGTQLIEDFLHQSPASLNTNSHYSGLTDTARVLYALQRARWTEASQIAEGLIARLSQHDSYGITGFVQAALAIALAAQNDQVGAINALRASVAPQRGLTQGLNGYVRLLRLRAKTWLHSADLVTEAQQVVDWARTEELAFIEIQALHIIACNSGAVTPETLDRVQNLASKIDATVAEPIRSHLARIGTQTTTVNISQMPEAQELEEYGIWLPTPLSPGLTVRERQIAVLASHGHSSRLISEQLHISSRTVETHLSNVFSKLMVDGRKGLRKWFVAERDEAGLQQL